MMNESDYNPTTHTAFGVEWTMTFSHDVEVDDLLRYGFPPCPLRDITNIYIRTGDYGRERVTISRVVYSGGFYFRTRPYIVSDSVRGNVWSRFAPEDRYLDNGDLSRGWENGWAKMTDAARKLVEKEFAPVVDTMLSDEEAVRRYWQASLASTAGHRRSEAQTALDKGNEILALTATIGGPVRKFAITEEA